jgi:hypothetical protein
MPNAWPNKLLLFSLLLLLLSFPLINCLSLTIHRVAMHSKIEKACEKMLAEQIRLDKAQHPKASTYKEFDYNGHRYDVITVADMGDFWLVTAMDDATEKWLEEQAEKESSNGRSFTHWIKTPASIKLFDLSVPLSNSVKINLPEIGNSIKIFIPVFSPPPEVSVA